MSHLHRISKFSQVLLVLRVSMKGSSPMNGVLISVLLSLANSKYQYSKTTLLTFHFHIFMYSTCNHFTHSGSSKGWQEKLLKQNAVRSQNAKLKCRKFSTLQKDAAKNKCFTVSKHPNMTIWAESGYSTMSCFCTINEAK